MTSNVDSSNDLVLKIETQKSDENPYANDNSLDGSRPRGLSRKIRKLEGMVQSRRNKIKNKYSRLKYSEFYEVLSPHSHLLLLVSVVLVCLFYSTVLRIRENFLLEKYSHSICLGLICLIDFLVNRDTYSISRGITFSKVSDEYDKLSLTQSLLSSEEENNPGNKNYKVLTFKKFIIFTITLAILCFTSELFTFYLLNVTVQEYNLNAGIGFALLAFEIIMIRLHYSMNNVKIEFTNFLGLLLTFFIFIFISLSYLSLPLAGVAFFISMLKFAKFYIFMELNYSHVYGYRDPENKKYTNNPDNILYIIILWVNVIDFLIGFILTFVYLIINDEHSFFAFPHFFLMLVASVCYYINMKYLRDFDRYGISIMALSYPLMIVFDLFINHRRVNFFELILILVLSVSIAISFVGDKLFKTESHDSNVDAYSHYSTPTHKKRHLEKYQD